MIRNVIDYKIVHGLDRSVGTAVHMKSDGLEFESHFSPHFFCQVN